MIDWRIWLLSAIARRFGLMYHIVGHHTKTRERAFLFADSELVAYGLALQFCVQYEQAHVAAAAARDLPDTHAAEQLH